MADEALLDKVQDLSDLELAALLCFIAEEHCIIDTEPDALDDLVEELKLVASNVFGLSHAVVDCSSQISLDDFATSILADAGHSESPQLTRRDSYFLQPPGYRSFSISPLSESFNDSRKIASVVIAKNLDAAPKQVQIQALELLRTKRIFTHTSIQSAPKRFLFIALVAGGERPRLVKQLNEHIFISHFHDPEDGYPNLEDLEKDDDSISSVVRKRAIIAQIEAASNPVFSEAEIDALEHKSRSIIVSPEITRYMYNIIAFLRLHRAVLGGVSAAATKHFDQLIKLLAPLHGLSYVSPSLVALAAKKIYPHRIEISPPEKERSMQWGSNVDAVTAELDGIGSDDVIDDVLADVEVPL